MGLCTSKTDAELRAIRSAEKYSKTLDDRHNADMQQEAQVKKFLLLGAGESGKSTIFKQLNQLYSSGYSEEVLTEFIDVIHSNIITSILTLLEKQEYFLERKMVEPLRKASRISAQFVYEVDKSMPITPRIGEHIALLWDDPAIKATYALRSKFQLIDSCKYFFQRVFIISKLDYVPSYDDILRCRARTTGIVEMEFKLEDTLFRIIDVGGQRNERRKWIHCFEDVTAVIFVGAINEYDQVLWEDDSVNRLIEALNLFDHIVNLQWFRKTSFILFLNKSDLLQEKILKVNLNVCFRDYRGGHDYENAVDYIRTKFENKNRQEKKVYTHVTCATNTDNIKHVFDAVSDIIIRRSLSVLGLVQT